MLNRFARALFTSIFRPIAALLVRRGVSPDVVTVIGTLGVVAGALTFFPRGEFFWGVIVITCFVFSDLIDGTMARVPTRDLRAAEGMNAFFIIPAVSRGFSLSSMVSTHPPVEKRIERLMAMQATIDATPTSAALQ